MKKLILITLCLILGLSVQAKEYYFLYNTPSDNYYKVSSNPFKYTDKQFRLDSATEQIVIETNIVYKPDWAIRAENLYTNGLAQLGYAGAHTNPASSAQAIGIVLLEQMLSPDPAVAEAAGRWKSILETVYEQLIVYAKTYGITDLRKFPYGSDIMVIQTNQSTIIEFRGINYYRRD